MIVLTFSLASSSESVSSTAAGRRVGSAGFDTVLGRSAALAFSPDGARLATGGGDHERDPGTAQDVGAASHRMTSFKTTIDHCFLPIPCRTAGSA